MNWLSFLGSAVLLLTIQYGSVESGSLISPWAEPASTRSFMNCLFSQIAGSNVLPIQEKEDLESIMDTLMSAVSEANARGKNNDAQLKAINMAIASSLAEIVVVEDEGNQASIAVKTQALSGALEQCFQLAMGTVDRKFINEINDLILMFAEEAVSEEAAQNQGGFATDGSLSSSSFQKSSQSADNTYRSGDTLQGSIKTAGGYRRGYSDNQASQSSLSSLKTASQSSDNTYRSRETIRGSTKTAGGYRRDYSGSQGSQNVQIRHRPHISRPERIGERSQVSEGRSGLETSSSLSTSSSQRAHSTRTGASSHSGGYSVRPDIGALRGPVVPIDNNLGRGGQHAGLITRIADALANSSTIKAVLRRGVSQKTAYNLIRRTAQSLANTLGIDKNTLGRKALQTISKIAPGSDSLAYSKALSTVLVNCGILTERNIDSMGPRVLSAVLNGLSSAGQSLGINVSNVNVQKDIQSSRVFLTASSSTSFSHSGDSETHSVASTTRNNIGRYPVESVEHTASSTVDSTIRAGTQGRLISRVTNALMNSDTFRALLERSVPPQTASNLIHRTVQSLADTFGINGNNFGRLALQALSHLSTRSDTSSYAQVLSSALVTGGILTENNIESVGPQVLSAVLNTLSSTGQSLGVNVDVDVDVNVDVNAQNDIVSSSGSKATSSSSTSFSQADSSASTEIDSTTGSYHGGFVSATRADLQAGLISRVTNALVNSSPFRVLLRRGVAPQTASNFIQRTVQSLANTFGPDGSKFGGIALQSLSQLSPRSDASSYAHVLSSALVTGGILDENNIDAVGPQVMSSVMNALSSTGLSLGINVDSINVQDAIESSSSAQTASSSSTSFSQSDSSASTEIAATSGGYSVGASEGPVAPTVNSSVRTHLQAGLISRITNALVNSSTFSALLRKDVAPETASHLMQRTVQSLANTFGFAGNNFGRTALQGLSQISSRSDTSSYAQVLSTALVTGGILDENNINSVGPQVMSTVLDTLSSAGHSLGISVDNIDVQNDIVSSSNSNTASSSSTSFSQSDSAASTEIASTTGGYTGRYPAGTLRGPIASVVDSSVRADLKVGLISRVTHSLLNSSLFRGLSRTGVAPEIASNLIQRTVQSLADNFGADGNNFSRIALQAFAQISPQSDISSYAQVLSTALVNGGILNENNIESVETQVLNALSSAGQSIGFSLDNTNVQNDIVSNINSQATSSSSTSFSHSDGSTSTRATSTTGGYHVGTLGGTVSHNIDSSSIGGSHTRLISRVANALVKSPTFRAVLRRGVSAHTASNLILRTAHSLADTLGVDGNNLGRIAIEAMSKLSPHSDTPAYAQILATSLVAGGILNESNIDSVGSQVLSAFLRGMSSVGQGLGMNVGNGHAQKDIQSGSNVQRTSSSSHSFSHEDDSSTYNAASSSVGQGRGMNVGNGHAQNDIQSGSNVQRTSSSSHSFSHEDDSSTYNAASTSSGGPGRHPVGIVGAPVGPTVGFSERNGPQAGLIFRVANALANSSTFSTLLRRGVQLQTASNMIQRTLQSLSNALGVDGNNLEKMTVEAFAQLTPDSDTPFYAQALSTALVAGGILNESNIDSVGPQILSFILNGLSSEGQGIGINIDTRNVENDIRSSSGYMGTSSSSSHSATEDETSTVLTNSSGYTAAAESVVGGQEFDYSADQTSAVQSSSNQGDFSESSGSTSSATNQDFSESSGLTSSATNQDFIETSGTVSSGAESSIDISVLRSLNSPIGLRSDSAKTRISHLASSILNSISPVGVDANFLARSLQASVSNLRSSGMSSSDAKIEVLMETIVGLLQLLSNAHVRGLNTSTASAVTSSAARSFELALAK